MADMGHGTVKIDKLLSQFVYLWRALEGAFEYLVGGNWGTKKANVVLEKVQKEWGVVYPLEPSEEHFAQTAFYLSFAGL